MAVQVPPAHLGLERRQNKGGRDKRKVAQASSDHDPALLLCFTAGQQELQHLRVPADVGGWRAASAGALGSLVCSLCMTHACSDTGW